MALLSNLTDLTTTDVKENFVGGTVISSTRVNSNFSNLVDRSNNLLDVLKDLEDNFASAAAPADTPEGKLWYDTTNNLLKVRRNAAWTALAVTNSPVFTTPELNDTSEDHQYIFAVSELSADRTVTWPLLTGNDTLVFEGHSATLSNKTLASPAISGSASGNATLPTAMLKADNGITQGMIGNSAVGQGELKTALQQWSAVIGSGAVQDIILGGGTYSFAFLWALDGGATGGQILAKDTNGYTSETRLYNSTGSNHTYYLQCRHVQASPPYNLGDGEVGLFIFLRINSGGQIVGVSMMTDPPWANNGPTPLNPAHPRVLSEAVNGVRRPKWLLEPTVSKPPPGASVKDVQAYMEVLRARKDDLDAWTPVEITDAVKNRDMDLVPSPWGGDLGTDKVVLVDPVSDLAHQALVWHEMQDSDFHIPQLLQDIGGDYLRVDNTKLSRAAPDGMEVYALKWR